LRAYEAQRLPATAAVVHSNRTGRPERIIDLAAARAPDGCGHIHEMATPSDLADITQGYARLAGFGVSSGSPS